MKQGWHSILRPSVQGSSTSFIGGKPMGLLLQVAENFNFEKLPDAPPEMERSYMGNSRYKARKEPNYTLFYEFNRVYLWGPEDPSDPVVYINVQNDV